VWASVCLIVWQLACAGPPPAPPEPVDKTPVYSDGRVLMGTLLELQLVSELPEARAAAERVYGEVGRLERLVSHYDPESTVSQLSDRAGKGPQDVEPEVVELIQASLRAGEQSRGMFDVTLGPAIDFWRTAEPNRSHRKEVARLRAMTGHDKLKLDPDGRVELAAPGMQLDFGGIAKGWALDRVLPLLRDAEIDAALLSFGQSSLWALGAPPGTEGWSLALRSPGGEVQGDIVLRDFALSVSSSLQPGAGEQGVEVGEPARGAILNPRTLRPVEQRAIAAVVASDAGTADAFSTALLVLDPYSGIKLIEAARGVEALIGEPTGQEWPSSGWARVTGYRSAEPGL